MHHLTFLSHTEQLRSAVQMQCMSYILKEDVVDTRNVTDTDQMFFSRSQTLSCNGEPDFPVEEFTSQSAAEFIQRWCTNSKTPVQTVKMTLNDSFARQQESVRLISCNISAILRSSYTRTPTQTRAHWQFELLYAFGCK